MSFTPERLDGILGSVREAVREAAAHAYRGYRHAPLIEHKGAVDLVTHFDRESEAILRSRLDGLFPIIGEELGDKTPDPGAEAIFYVDPIDGTTNFVHGHPFWCVSVGARRAGDGAPDARRCPRAGPRHRVVRLDRERRHPPRHPALGAEHARGSLRRSARISRRAVRHEQERVVRGVAPADFDGQASASSITTGHVVASNGAIHETLLAELRSVSGPRSVRPVRLT